MIGVFVPWPKDHSRTGYIIDGNGCHVWVGRLHRGYAYGSHEGRTRRIHRVRYELEIGPIPEGLVLDHFFCDNTACVNPRHVRPVSQRENLMRGNGVSAQALTRTHCPKGHPLTDRNLVVYRLKLGERLCLTCQRAHNRKHGAKYRLRARGGTP